MKRLERTRLGAVIDQLLALTAADLRSRYGRGRWQLVKWLIDPFALVGVYLLMVVFIFYRRPHDIGLSLTCSIIPFQLIVMTVQSSMTSISTRQSIIGNMHFRRSLLPVSTALTEVCGFGASLTLLAGMMIAYRATPTSAILWLVPALLITILFGVAIAYPVTLLGVWAADTRGLILSAVRAAYYIAPGLVTLAAIHGRTNFLVRLNPLTGLFESIRHAVQYRSAPAAWELIVPVVWSLILLAVFVPVYNREQNHFAKLLD